MSKRFRRAAAGATPPPTIEAIDWTTMTNASDDGGGDITKAAGPDAWNGGGEAVQVLSRGGDYATCKFSTTSTHAMFGLAPVGLNFALGEPYLEKSFLMYGELGGNNIHVHIGPQGSFNPVLTTNFGGAGWDENSVFKVRISDDETQLFFEKDDVIFHTEDIDDIELELPIKIVALLHVEATGLRDGTVRY